MKYLYALYLLTLPVSAADLILLSESKSDYQIVLPDKLPTPELTECLAQTARLVQTAFKANGADVPVVTESARDAARPAIYLGSTAFARQHGVDTAKLDGWSYVQSAVGRDLIVAGHDQPPPASDEGRKKREVSWNFVGTAKGAADFVRQFMGVRFLYPEVLHNTEVSAAAKVDLLASPAIEFLPLKSISVPGDLQVKKTPVLRINTAHPPSGGFYDLAHNRFPRVDEMFGTHTWARAVPPEKYFATHPEYFALINGQRLNPEDKAQYCLSNPDVQELIYQDLVRWLDVGYGSVDLGQPDGFRECQCENCLALFGTGKDWSEKIWIFNRRTAERLLKSHPAGHVTMMSYILTAAPPKTFKEFPANTRIMLTGTNEDDIAPWRACTVPGGFTGYVYNWCPNLCSRYTPMRTPQYVESQAKRLAVNRIQSIYRDGPGQEFGLEGPVYYVMGRMFDDPEHNSAKDLLPEFCDAAFGRAAPAMRSFYDQLYHAIMLYSDHIGTRTDVWSYLPIEGARKRKTVTDPFQLLAFLYTPNVLAALDADLTQSEKLANSDKIKTRLALVRTEFEYVRHLARVVHLYQAFSLQPDLPSRDRLLDAIDARNAAIDALYDKGRSRFTPGWSRFMFPPSGHAPQHLRLAQDGYQEPFANTCLNWDTKSMRTSPLPGKKRLTVSPATAPVTLDAPAWQTATAHELTVIPPLNKLPRKTTLRLLYDKANLYVRAEGELEPDGPANFPASKRDQDLRARESLDLYLAPQPGSEIAYRFMVGANANSKYDAASGFISDVMDPRHGKDDPTWNGDWQSESRIDEKEHRWHALITIPFKTLAAPAPAAGAAWRGNFARHHQLLREKMDQSIWSSTIGSSSIDDRGVFGEIVFE